MAAVFTADYIVSVYEKRNKFMAWITNIQFGLMNVFLVVLGVVLFMVFPPTNVILPIVLVLLLILFYISYFKISDKLEKLIAITIIANVMVNLQMATNFYPQLLNYQANSTFGRMAFDEDIPEDKFYYYQTFGHALDFYAQRIVPELDIDKILEYDEGTYVVTDKKGGSEIMEKSRAFEVVDSLPDYSVTILRTEFMFQSTREKALRTKYLLYKTQ